MHDRPQDDSCRCRRPRAWTPVPALLRGPPAWQLKLIVLAVSIAAAAGVSFSLIWIRQLFPGIPSKPNRQGGLPAVSVHGWPQHGDPGPRLRGGRLQNRFPALGQPRSGDMPPESASLRSDDLLGASTSAGRCEVICYTSDHDASFADLSSQRALLVTEALIDRTRELSALRGVQQVYCFENRGQEIGVTQPHPHGQIYGYPFVTPRTARMLHSSLAYERRTGRNLFDDVVAAERADGSRVIVAGTHWTAFVRCSSASSRARTRAPRPWQKEAPRSGANDHVYMIIGSCEPPPTSGMSLVARTAWNQSSRHFAWIVAAPRRS
jgi:hypothetical protein